MHNRIYLNDGWQFTESFSEALLKPQCDITDMETVRLPHTCKETPFHYFDEHIYQMVSGYRKTFLAEEAWKGKRVLLTLEGAAHDSEVSLNGVKIGAHHCGYTAFTVDLSQQLSFDTANVLVVKVDSRENLNIPPFGYVVDYMTYGGLYREAYLEIKNQTSLEDVFLKSCFGSELSETKWEGQDTQTKLSLVTELEIRQPVDGMLVRQYISPKADTKEERQPEQLLGEKAVREAKEKLTFPVQGIRLWDVDNPHLYRIKTQLWQGQELLDERVDAFGFRKAEFRKDGFYLNNRKVKIRGLNRHQSYPYVGYAMPKSMQRMDADILKTELGVNAVRTSHYPQSHYFLERCDELGLLVFTELPGWQHIGNEAWKEQAIQNVKDMVKQYRNHTSIILWGVRINESADDDAFYERTNKAAHELDDTRPTGGVRAHKKSSLLEDVYTYNDFVHAGDNKGCEKKGSVTSDIEKPYLVSEYNGHMYPTKAFDWEEHRAEHMFRHARVLDAIAQQQDIAGSFGWCMFDYNTHKDFGSGDRICYHGVMDMFRNPKLAAEVYADCQTKDIRLEVSSSMDIGEHPGCNRGDIYMLTNADSVRMYKNDRFVKEYSSKDSTFKNLEHGPIRVDDFIGNAIEEQEDFKPGQAKGVKSILNAVARHGLANLPKSVYLTAAKMMLLYRMNPGDAVALYNKFVGDWGGTSTVYRFEAIQDGKVVRTVTKAPMHEMQLQVSVDHTQLKEETSYDVAAVRLEAQDEYGNLLPFYNEPVLLETEGPIALIGPKVISLQGGMGGTYIKTLGEEGKGILKITTQNVEKQIVFTVEK